MAVNAKALEGSYDDVVHYHLDMDNDVLYLRLVGKDGVEAYGDDTDDGFTLLRSLDDDSIVGMVVISFWKRFGGASLRGVAPDRVKERMIEAVEAFESKLAVAA